MGLVANQTLSFGKCLEELSNNMQKSKNGIMVQNLGPAEVRGLKP